MKKIILFTTVITCLLACNSAISQKLKKEDVCSTVKKEAIAAITKWDANSLIVNQDFSFKKYRFSVCNYSVENSSNSVVLKQYHQNDKNIEYKTLEKHYKNIIANGDANYVYREIKGHGTQSVLGVLKNRGLFFYQLKTRLENTHQVIVDIASTTPISNNAETQLLQLSNLLLKQ